MYRGIDAQGGKLTFAALQMNDRNWGIVAAIPLSNDQYPHAEV